EDANETAFRVVSEATGEKQPEPESKKNPAAVALGRLGGLKGGKARAAKLTPEERRRIAKKAAAARWRNRRQ
ncbi:MAG TPA: histone H1, partial [Anaerolineae bacterium]|nr:histone H1 [Anaerolineae bacterium]